VASVSPAPCEEGVFYRFALACQAATGEANLPWLPTAPPLEVAAIRVGRILPNPR